MKWNIFNNLETKNEFFNSLGIKNKLKSKNQNNILV